MEERAISPGTFDRGVNTTLRVSNGPSFRRVHGQRPGSAFVSTSDIIPLINHQQSPSNSSHHTVVTLIVVKDDKGYGMKISGDNPVYVQSVKDGGAAEKAGLHSGDKIIKVNGLDVTQSTHTKVVELIKSCVEVELTVQQRLSVGSRSPAQIVTSTANCVSPMPPVISPTPNIPSKPPAQSPNGSNSPRDRITGPQPVDFEKLKQLECQRVQTFRLMLEREQSYVESLRNELTRCTDGSREQQISRNLMGAERRVRTLQEQLSSITTAHHNSTTINSGCSSPSSESLLPAIPPPPPPLYTLPTRIKSLTGENFPNSYVGFSAGGNSTTATSGHNCHSSAISDSPPPLPLRNNRNLTSPVMVPTSMPASAPPLPPRNGNVVSVVNDHLDGIRDGSFSGVTNSPSSPLPHHHQRTKSSPDQISHSVSLPPEVAPRLVSSESLGDLPLKTSKGGISWDVGSTLPRIPPGTPPPPYIGFNKKSRHSSNCPALSSNPISQDELDDSLRENKTILSPGWSNERLPNNNSLINSSIITQHPIISMEDDDMSDQEMSNLEDHGPFKNFTKLQERNAHLAVFLNYVISNSDPSSLLFYLITNLYKEGKSAEMKKWAYEIHSSFLVPGAPLRLSNVDENIAREIDETLLNDSDKEEELRKIFQKARRKAREEINEQLTDFQLKRTAGLGTIFGPPDVQLDESINDKSKEAKIVEQVLVPQMEPFIDDIEKDIVDDRRFATAAAFGTILSKLFGIRSAHFVSLLDRCPTFVSKDKTKSKLIGRSKKVTIKGHHFLEHQYYTVTYCNHCQLIIWGIGPQGYQCTNCLLNIHRPCVKVLEENCPGPLMKKEKIKRTVMEKFLPGRGETKRKPGSFYSPPEKMKKSSEEREENGIVDAESGEKSSTSSVFNTRGSGRVEPVKETEERVTGCGGTPISSAAAVLQQDSQYNSENENQFRQEILHSHGLKQHKSSGASINRSESYKERIHQRRQIREKRKTSDPNLPITNSDVETDASVHPFSYATVNSGSSSNSNLSTRSLDSPSNSLEAVSNNNSVGRNSCDNTVSGNNSNVVTVLANSICSSGVNRTSAWDSDTEAEPDPPDWTKFVSEEELKRLSSVEKKRQEVINELFHTERSHVRALKILDKLFYQPMKEHQILPLDQIHLLFPNLDEMLDIHSQFNNNMKQRKKENPIVLEIGDILLKMFDGMEGETFQHAAATFCSRQQIALVLLKERRRKDPKLNNFLSDAEGNPICRRLQLKDIIPTGMLRLTKYPLLFENLAKYSHYNVEEERCVQRALERSKEILNHVNAAVKEAEDQHRLTDIQKRLDKSLFDKIDHPVTNEFKNLDLTKHKLVYEGSLNWRITNRQKLIELHVLLLEDVIILLQKQDEKYVLKFYNTNSIASERTPVLSPVIKVSTALVRPNAADKKALYLVNTSHNGAQIYDLVASSSAEKKTWFKHISEAAEAYKTKDGKHRTRTADPSPVAVSHDLESNSDCSQQHASVKHRSDEIKSEESGIQDDNQNVTNVLNSFGDTDSPAKKLGGGGVGKSPSRPRKRVTEPPRLTTEENPLIEPSQVLISQRSVLTAEPVLTPLERLRRKDELIRNTLKEKQQLAADILHVSREEYESVSIASSEEVVVSDKDASELVLSLANQGNQLIAIINEHLQISEEEAIVATSEVHNQQQVVAPSSKVTTNWSQRTPSIPVCKLQSVANGINSNATRLISAITERDDERERLRQELQKSREQLHALHEVLQRMEQNRLTVVNNTSQTQSEAVIDQNVIDVKQKELSVNEIVTSEGNTSSVNVENHNNNNNDDNNVALVTTTATTTSTTSATTGT